MKTKMNANDMVRAIGNKEIQDNFKRHLLPGFESHFPGAIEVVADGGVEVYVNDIPLIKDIIDFIRDCDEVDEPLLGINWIHEYADQENYVKQIIPFKVNKGQKVYVCPENR